MAMAIMIRPMRGNWFFQTEKIALPTDVPKMIAMKVLISNRPLPRERSLSGSISGKMPYLAGLKKAECKPIRKTAASMGRMSAK